MLIAVAWPHLCGREDVPEESLLMMRAATTLTLVGWLCAASAAAQSPISSSRRIDWSAAGVPGGIPARTTVCATFNPGATAAQINSAIAACPAGQVVLLNAGTYNL